MTETPLRRGFCAVGRRGRLEIDHPAAGSSSPPRPISCPKLLSARARPPGCLLCSEVAATLHIHSEASADEESLTRLSAALDELTAALGLDKPPPIEMGTSISFHSMSAVELREKLLTVKTDKRGLFHVSGD
jgi:hypothetical protein